jgi:hypothetical protein
MTREDHQAGAGGEQRDGQGGRGGAAAGAGRADDREGGGGVREVHAHRGDVVAAEAQQAPHRPAELLAHLLVRVREGDLHRQGADAGGPAVGRESGVAAGGLRADPAQCLGLLLAGGAGGEQGHLDLGAAVGGEAAAGEDEVGDVARPLADGVVVGLVVQAQQQLVVVEGGGPAGEQGAFGGGDDVQARGGALAQEPVELFHQAAAVVVGDGLDQRVPAVDEQHDVRRTGTGAARLAELGEVAGVPFGEELLTAFQFPVEPGEQLLQPLDVAAGHDGTAVRQHAERGEGAAGEVDAVEVDVGAGVSPGEGTGHGAEYLAAAGARDADDVQVSELGEVQSEGQLGLCLGQVRQAPGDGGPGGRRRSRRVGAGRRSGGSGRGPGARGWAAGRIR